jgi:hypothetical protein
MYPKLLYNYITSCDIKELRILPHAYAIFIYVFCMNLKTSTNFFPKNSTDRLAFIVEVDCALCEAGVVGVQRVKLVSYGF